MELYAVLGAALVGLIACALLRSLKSPLAGPAAAACSILLAAAALGKLSGIVRWLGGLFGQGAGAGAAGVLLKGFGAALLTSLAGGVCRDLGEDGLREKLELFGACWVISLALPLLGEVIEGALALTGGG